MKHLFSSRSPTFRTLNLSDKDLWLDTDHRETARRDDFFISATFYTDIDTSDSLQLSETNSNQRSESAQQENVATTLPFHPGSLGHGHIESMNMEIHQEMPEEEDDQEHVPE